MAGMHQRYLDRVTSTSWRFGTSPWMFVGAFSVLQLLAGLSELNEYRFSPDGGLLRGISHLGWTLTALGYVLTTPWRGHIAWVHGETRLYIGILGRSVRLSDISGWRKGSFSVLDGIPVEVDSKGRTLSLWLLPETLKEMPIPPEDRELQPRFQLVARGLDWYMKFWVASMGLYLLYYFAERLAS